MKKIHLCLLTTVTNLTLLYSNTYAQVTPTLDSPAYSIDGDLNGSYTVNVELDKIDGYNTTFSDANDGTATGSATILLPDGAQTIYYTYEQPDGYTTVTSRNNNSDLSNKTFTIDTYNNYIANAITGVSDNSLVVTSDFVANPHTGDVRHSRGVANVVLNGIVGDFIGNYTISGSSDGAQGGAILQASYGKYIGFIKGDFINNYTRAKYTSQGGAVYNASGNTIGSITGNFIGNHINNIGDVIFNGSIAYGGALYNGANIGSITGNFVGNYIWTTFPQAFGGAIVVDEHGTINSIEGDFIANYAFAKGPAAHPEYQDTAAEGGAIYTDNGATIHSIKGDFVGNFASGSTNNAYGGAIYNRSGNIGSIEANFIGNYAIAANASRAKGGAIYNENVVLPLLTGVFLNNYAEGESAYGGAIYNLGVLTLTNTTLKNNYAKATGATAQGGAIWSQKTVNLNADNAEFLIEGNYVETSNGRRNEAIYMKSTYENSQPLSGTLNLNATNNGRFVIYDNINGDDRYNLNAKGDGTGVVDMYGFIGGKSIFTTSNVIFNYRQMDNTLTTTEFQKMTINDSSSVMNYYVDINQATRTADMIHSYSSSTGHVTLNGIHFIGGPTFDPTSGNAADISGMTFDSNFVVQILDVKTSDIQLVLSDELAAMVNQIVSTETFSETDSIAANTAWSKVYKATTGTRNTVIGLGLATTHTTNDSIGFSTRTEVSSSETILGDTLALVAHDTTNPVKTFSTTNPNAVYVLGGVYDVDGVGEVKGQLTVKGAISGNKRSTLDMNHKKGFELGSSNVVLNLSSMTIKNAQNAPVVDSRAGKVNVNNVIFEDNNSGSVWGSALYLHSYGYADSIVNSIFRNNRSTSERGGAIMLQSVNPIDLISNSLFESNVVTGGGQSAGGAIAVECGEIETITSSVFRNNYASSWGGAIYNGASSRIGEIVNSSFYNNHAGSNGGAIFSQQDLNIIANNGSSTFSGNYVGSNTDNRQAIYMFKASSTLTLSAVNNGVMTFDDAISGAQGYSTVITGNNTGRVNLYNNISNSHVQTSGAVTINTANSDLFTYNLLTLNSSASTRYAIDVDVNQRLADLFNTTNLSSGTITLTALNVIAGNFADVTDENFKIQVINNENLSSTLQLALATSLTNQEFLLNSSAVTSSDEIQVDTDWSDIYNSNDDTRRTYGRLGLATTRTTNDSIGIVVTRTENDEDQNPLGDTLALVSGADLEERNFTTDSADSTYTLTEDIGDVADGTLTINGTIEDDNRSTLDMNSMEGFTLSGETTMNLNNVEVVNGSGTVINATSSDAEVNLTNVNVTQNTSNDAVISANTTVNITADAQTSSFTSNTADNAIYVDGANLNLSAQNSGVLTFDDNISGNDYDVNILGDNSGMVRFNNHVNAVENLTFDNGAVANIGLDANIAANSMYQTSADATSTLVVDINVNQAAQTTSAGLIELVGQLSGNYNVIVNPANDDIYDGAYALFLSAPNDNDSSDESFTVTRVYGNPYLWEARRNLKTTDIGSMWYLALSGTTPDPVEPDPVEPDPVEPDPVEPDPVEPDPVEPDPVEPDPVEPDPVEPDPVEPDPVEPDPVEPDPVEPDPVEPDPVEPDPVEADPVEPDPVEPDPVEPDPVEPDPVEPDPVEPDPVEPDPVEPDPVEPDPVVAPEVIAGIGLHEASIEQNRSVVRNVKSKVDANRYYCNHCDISYDRYWRGRQLNDLWVLAQGENANIDAPVDMEVNIYDVEGGFDVQSDIHNTLGVFASYRKGDYDLSGKSDMFRPTGGSNIDIDSWLAGLYYRYDRNMTWVFATLYGGIQKADIKTDDGVAKFDTEGTQYGASLEIGHSFFLNRNLVLDPSVGVYYTQVDFDDAKDNVGKEYSWDEIKHLEIEVGAKLERQMFRGDVYVKPSVIQTITNGDSVFITGLGNIDGTYEDQTLFRIEVGGRYNFNRSTYGYAWANYTVGSEYDAIAAGLGLNYAW